MTSRPTSIILDDPADSASGRRSRTLSSSASLYSCVSSSCAYLSEQLGSLTLSASTSTVRDDKPAILQSPGSQRHKAPTTLTRLRRLSGLEPSLSYASPSTSWISPRIFGAATASPDEARSHAARQYSSSSFYSPSQRPSEPSGGHHNPAMESDAAHQSRRRADSAPFTAPASLSGSFSKRRNAPRPIIIPRPRVEALLATGSSKSSPRTPSEMSRSSSRGSHYSSSKRLSSLLAPDQISTPSLSHSPRSLSSRSSAGLRTPGLQTPGSSTTESEMPFSASPRFMAPVALNTLQPSPRLHVAKGRRDSSPALNQQQHKRPLRVSRTRSADPRSAAEDGSPGLSAEVPQSPSSWSLWSWASTSQSNATASPASIAPDESSVAPVNQFMKREASADSDLCPYQWSSEEEEEIMITSPKAPVRPQQPGRA